MKLRHPIIELALVALAMTAILYMIAKGHLPPPRFVVGGLREPAGVQLKWQWPGCWRTTMALPFSNRDADLVCAV